MKKIKKAVKPAKKTVIKKNKAPLPPPPVPTPNITHIDLEIKNTSAGIVWHKRVFAIVCMIPFVAFLAVFAVLEPKLFVQFALTFIFAFIISALFAYGIRNIKK